MSKMKRNKTIKIYKKFIKMAMKTKDKTINLY